MKNFLWESIKYAYQFYAFTNEERFSHHLTLANHFAENDDIRLANEQIVLGYLARSYMKDGYLLPTVDVLLKFYSPNKLILDQVYAEYASSLAKSADYVGNVNNIGDSAAARILYAILSGKATDNWRTRSIENEWRYPQIYLDYSKALINDNDLYDLLTPLLIMKGDHQLILKTPDFDYYPNPESNRIRFSRKGLQTVWDEANWGLYDEMIESFNTATAIHLRLQARETLSLTQKEIIGSISDLNRFLHIKLKDVKSNYQPLIFLIQLYALQYRVNKLYIKKFYSRLGKRIHALEVDDHFDARTKECIKEKYLYDYLTFLSKQADINSREINVIRNELLHTITRRHRLNKKSVNFVIYQPLLKLNPDSELLTTFDLQQIRALKSRYSNADVMRITRPQSLFKTSANLFRYQDIEVKTTNENLLSQSNRNSARY